MGRNDHPSRRVADEGVRIAEEAGLDAEPMTVEANGPVWKTVKGPPTATTRR